MPRSGPNGTYTLPGAQATQQPGTPIPSAVNNQGWSDAEQTFNTIQPIAYGGTGVSDGKPLDNVFGIKNNADPTKIGVFNATNIPTATTRTYDLPSTSGQIALTSDLVTIGRVRAATVSNITIATALNSGDVIDGVTLADGDLVLVKNQTAAADNGVYVVGVTPIRSPSYSTWASFMASPFTVAEGTVNAVTSWISATPKAGTIGVTAIPFRPQARIWEPIETRTLSLQNEDFIGLSAYVMLRITLYCLPSNNGEAIRLRTSTNNGVSFDSGASDYIFQFDRSTDGSPSGGRATDNYGLLSQVASTNTAGSITCQNIIGYAFNKALPCRFIASGSAVDTAAAIGTGTITSIRSQSSARDAFRIFVVNGTISGFAILEGVRG